MANRNNDIPDVTVVIPCFNSEKFIARAIKSVLEQTELVSEVIVIDDGSSDKSLEKIRSFSDSIIFKSGPNSGAPAARNVGLSLATGDFVAFLDADDFYEGEFLRGQLDTLAFSGRNFSIGPCVVKNARGLNVERVLPSNASTKAFLVDWISGKWLPPAAVLWRTSFLKEVGGWRTDIKRNQDGELIYRAALSGNAPAVSAQGVAVYWQHKSVTRINNTVSDDSIYSSFEVMKELVANLETEYDSDDEVRNALSYATHALERYAARHSLKTVESAIREFRQQHGYKPILGSKSLVLLARIVGLRRKEIMVQGFDKYRRRLKFFTHWLLEPIKSNRER